MNTKQRTYLVQNQEQLIQQELNPGEQVEISRLINSMFYYIDCVFIIKLKNKYRLAALHKKRVLCDCYFLSAEECQIAFDKLFKDKAWFEEVKANWSQFYQPDQEWLAKKHSYLEKGKKHFAPEVDEKRSPRITRINTNYFNFSFRVFHVFRGSFS